MGEWKAIESAPPLRAIHWEEADMLEYVERDVPTVSRPLLCGLDLLLDMKTRQPVGWRITDWSAVKPQEGGE